MARRLRTILVVIPAHNEERYILDCLEAVDRSKLNLQAVCPGIAVHTMVVLDTCTDSTAQRASDFAATHPGYFAHHVNFGNVGATRAFGIAQGLNRLPGPHGTSETWIACTDADTKVPENWLEEFAVAYLGGADAVTGTVEPDRVELAPQLYRQWRERYVLAPHHPHIHGANLGISAAAYSQVGGFKTLAAHEDVELVARLRRFGYRVVATDQLHAVTSGRLEGRLKSGFADYLSALAGETGTCADNSLDTIRAG